MAYRKVIKKGKVDWGAFASNAYKRHGVSSRKAARAKQTASNKAARAAKARQTASDKEAKARQTASDKEAKARLTAYNKTARAAQTASNKAAKARQTASNKAAKAAIKKQEEKTKAAIKGAAAAKRAREKQIALAKKEEANREKKLKRLNGLFLEHDIPLKLFDVDLREIALNFDEENGISSVSGFKKVTIPHLEKSLYKLARKMHINNTFGPLFESELKKVATTSEIYNHSQILKFKSKCQASLYNALPKILNFDDFSSFADPVNAEVISEYIEVNILPIVPAIIATIKAAIKKQEKEAKAAIKKQEEEAKQRAKEKKELDTGCQKVKANFDKTIDESVKLGKSMKTQIDKMKSELEALDESYKSTWFGKEKFAKEAQGLGSVIWKRTPQLIEMILLIEDIVKILKYRAENSSIDIHTNPKVNQTLEESGYYKETLDRFKKLYSALFKNLEMRLINLERALNYYEDDKELIATERVKNEGLKLSKDSKNLIKIFSKFGG